MPETEFNYSLPNQPVDYVGLQGTQQSQASQLLSNVTGVGQTSSASPYSNIQQQDYGTIPSLATQGNPYGQSEVNASLVRRNDAATKSYETYMEDMSGLSGAVKTGAQLTQGLGSLANIYLGFQQLGLAKDQAKMAKEQWAEQKQELAHVRGVRKRITSSYMN